VCVHTRTGYRPSLQPIPYHLQPALGAISAEDETFEECLFRSLHCTTVVVPSQMEAPVDKKETHMFSRGESIRSSLTLRSGYVQEDFTTVRGKRKRKHICRRVFVSVCNIEPACFLISDKHYGKLIFLSQDGFGNHTKIGRIPRPPYGRTEGYVRNGLSGASFPRARAPL